MVILIGGASHTGKTVLAQKLLEKYHYPYLSIDHRKMGIIRSKETSLTVFDDEELVDYLWPIIQAIIKTAIENKQNLIIEGFYIPYNYSAYFTEQKLSSIDYHCLVMTPTYIENNFTLILKHSNVIETRIVDSNVTKEMLTAANQRNLEQC